MDIGEQVVPALLDLSERVMLLDEFQGLTVNQKALCLAHVLNPSLTKAELAQKAGVSKVTTYEFFHSKKWEIINHELAKQQLRELVQLSVKTLRNCMLNGSSMAKLEAATKVLINAGLLASPYARVSKQDDKVVVLWKDDVIDVEAKSDTNLKTNNGHGNNHTILPSPEAEGSSQLRSAV